jgi:hypothetical protein
MAYFFPEGSTFSFQVTSGLSSKNVTAVTNANPAVATSVAHGYVDNDEVLFISGWEDATDTVFRVDQQSVDSFQFLGLDSSSTAYYPAGGGTGTTQKMSTWTTIPQVLSVSTSGGDARFTQIAPLARRNATQVATGFNPSSMTLTLGHDPSNAAWIAMVAASRTLSKVAFKVVLGGGGTMYGYGYLSVSELPQLASNQANTVTAVISLLGRPISYST